MRFIFKTAYTQDIALAKHGGHTFWYSVLVLALLAAPWVFTEYWLAQLTFVLIYSIAALGIMLLAGFTGLFSLGHAAFLGVGAYTQAVLSNAGVPFPLALLGAGTLSAATGWVVGLPALRVKGIYLGMATLSFGFIVEEVLARWESVTGGNAGMHIEKPNLFGWVLETEIQFYFLCLLITVLATLGIVNLARAHGPCICRDSRFGNFSAKHGHSFGALQNTVVCAVCGAGRHRRRVVCAQTAVHLARPVQHLAVD